MGKKKAVNLTETLATVFFGILTHKQESKLKKKKKKTHKKKKSKKKKQKKFKMAPIGCHLNGTSVTSWWWRHTGFLKRI